MSQACRADTVLVTLAAQTTWCNMGGQCGKLFTLGIDTRSTPLLLQAFKELGREFPAIMAPLIYERDQYMVAVMRRLAGRCATCACVLGRMCATSARFLPVSMCISDERCTGSGWLNQENADKGPISMVQRITRRGGRGSGPPAGHQVRLQWHREAGCGAHAHALEGRARKWRRIWRSSRACPHLACRHNWQHHDCPTTVDLNFQGKLGGRHRRGGDLGNAAATAQHAAVCAAGDRGGAVDSGDRAVAPACCLKPLC